MKFTFSLDSLCELHLSTPLVSSSFTVQNCSPAVTYKLSLERVSLFLSLSLSLSLSREEREKVICNVTFTCDYVIKKHYIISFIDIHLHKNIAYHNTDQLSS